MPRFEVKVTAREMDEPKWRASTQTKSEGIFFDDRNGARNAPLSCRPTGSETPSARSRARSS